MKKEINIATRLWAGTVIMGKQEVPLKTQTLPSIFNNTMTEGNTHVTVITCKC